MRMQNRDPPAAGISQIFSRTYQTQGEGSSDRDGQDIPHPASSQTQVEGSSSASTRRFGDHLGIASLLHDSETTTVLTEENGDFHERPSPILHATSPTLVPPFDLNYHTTLCHVLAVEAKLVVVDGGLDPCGGLREALHHAMEMLVGDGEEQWLPLSNEVDRAAWGRYGPLKIEMERSSDALVIKREGAGLVLECHSPFSSARGNVCVRDGCWMYEATLATAGIQQLGWATKACPFDSKMGVGDGDDSYAYDGKRVRRWNKDNAKYGQPWVPGDVIGCCMDLTNGVIVFYRNGVSMGTAFSHVRRLPPGEGYHPAVSLSQNERCELNFGGRPFRYPIRGFMPLQPPPMLITGTFVSMDHDRDDRAHEHDDGGGEVPPESPAVAVGAATAAWQSRVGKVRAKSSLAMPHVRYLIGCLQRLVQLVNRGTQAAASGAVKGRDIQEWAEQFRGTVASVLMDPLGPLLMLGAEEIPTSLPAETVELPRQSARFRASYPVWGALVPALLAMHRRRPSHDGESVDALVALLFRHLPADCLEACVPAVMDALSYECRTAAVATKQQYTAAYPFLALACRLLRNRHWVQLWWQSPGFQGCLEGLLTRKGPNKVDLAGLFPTVFWPGAKGEPLGNDAAMRETQEQILAAVAKVEEMQVDLCIQLLRFRPQLPTLDDKLSSTSYSRGCVFRSFLRQLIKRNSKINSNVPPPGLSDLSVILSTFFVLLRLLSDTTDNANWHAPDGQEAKRDSGRDAELERVPLLRAKGRRSFPVSRFCGNDVYSMDLPRLGGTFSHLVKAVPDPMEGKGSDLSWDSDARWDADVAVEVVGEDDVAEVSGRVGSGSAVGSEEQLSWLLAEDVAAVGQQVAPGQRGEDIGVEGEVAAMGKVTREATGDVGGRAGGREESVRWGEGCVGNVVAEEQEMCDLMVVLYHLGLNSYMKQANFYAQSQMQNVAHLEEAEREMQRSRSQDVLLEAQARRDVYREDVIENLRCGAWYRVTLFATWKQEGVYRACVWIVQLLLATSAAGRVFGYVPECYVETLVDAFHGFLRRSSNPPFGHPYLLLNEELSSLVTFLVKHFHDTRIANPDVRDSLLQSISVLLQNQEYIHAFEANTVARETLVGSLLASFDNRLWIPISNIILNLRRGTASTNNITHHHHHGTSSTRTYTNGCCCSPLFHRLLRQKCESDPQLFGSFLNQLFNTLTWTVSEFSIALKDLKDLLDNNPEAQVSEIQQRKCLIWFELSCSLERVLEFLAEELPQAFLLGGARSRMNLERLCEVVSFVLNLTTISADAELLDRSVKRRRLQFLEKLNRPQILVPVVGILTALSSASATQASHGQGCGGHDLAEALAQADHTSTAATSLDFLLSFNWMDPLWSESALPRLSELGSLSTRLKLKMEEQRRAALAREEEAEKRRERSSAAAAAAGGAAAQEEEPQEDLCSICWAYKVDTVFVPCNHTSCRHCITRHLLNIPRCFFCNANVVRVEELPLSRSK